MQTSPNIPDLTLLRRIGRGSYGEVWIARTLTGVYRAVKVVYRARFEDDRPFLRELDGITRFQRSAGDQPRQLALMHVGRDDANGFFYYVMELADDVERGTDIDPEVYEPFTLKSLREREVLLPAAEAVRLGVELARALRGLHEAGLIHRDVKPSNIIIVAGSPKLADIGLVSSGDHTLTSLGTPGYSPPEGAGTIRADLFSLGRILYELSTGRGPDEFPRLPTDIGSRRDVNVLLELNEVVLRACDPVPANRYASVAEMLEELLLIQAGKSVKELLHVRRRLKMLGRAATAVGAAAALVIAVLGVRHYFTLRALAAAEMQARFQAEDNERLARYTADLNLAQLALDSADIGMARKALRRQIPNENSSSDLRGLEWHALWGDTAGQDSRQLGQLGGPRVAAIALSPDGAMLGAQEGERNRETVVWDLRSGERRALTSDTFGLGGFTPEGLELIVGTVDRGVRLVSVATGEARTVENATGRLVASRADGRTVLLGALVENRAVLTIWDVVAGVPVSTWESESRETEAGVAAEGLSPDGSLLAVSLFWLAGPEPRNQLIVWDLPSQSERFRRIDVGRARTTVFSRDGKKLAVGGPGIDTRIIDTTSGLDLQQFPEGGNGVASVAFAEDERSLASIGEDQELRIWNIADGTLSARLVGHESRAGEVIVSSDGASLFSAGDDGVIREWRLPATSRPIARSGFWDGNLGGVVVRPGVEMLFATLGDGRLSRIGTNTLAPVGPDLPAFHPLSSDEDHLRALTSDLRLVEIDLSTNEARELGLQVPQIKSLNKIGASASGRIVALGYMDGTVEFWDAGEAPRTIPANVAHAATVRALGVSPDGAWAATGDGDGRVIIWSPVSGTASAGIAAERSGVVLLEFSPDGSVLLIGRDDGTASLFDRATLTRVGTLAGHTGIATAAAFSQDGHRIVTGGDDGLIIVWEAASLSRLATLTLGPGSAAGTDRLIYQIEIGATAETVTLAVLTEGGVLRRWGAP